jgi:hypothetical protein
LWRRPRPKLGCGAKERETDREGIHITVTTYRSCLPAKKLVVITVNKQVVPSTVAQRISIVKFLTNENLKPAEILKKAAHRLRTCEEYTFCRENYDQRFSGLSRLLIHRFCDRTTNHQRSLLFRAP